MTRLGMFVAEHVTAVDYPYRMRLYVKRRNMCAGKIMRHASPERRRGMPSHQPATPPALFTSKSLRAPEITASA